MLVVLIFIALCDTMKLPNGNICFARGDFMKSKLSKSVIFALCAFFIIIIGILSLLWYSGVFITDRSAKVGFEGMVWNGKNYSTISGEYTEGRTIAKSEDGSWDINEIKEDPSHKFVVARSFLDQYLYVSDDYTVPKSGKITKVCWNEKYIQNKDFLKAMAEIDAAKTATFDYETEGIFMLTENQHMRRLYFAYDECPIATEYKGYMGKVNGKWVITTYISSDQNNPDGSPKPYSVTCYSIPDKFFNILEKHFS